MVVVRSGFEAAVRHYLVVSYSLVAFPESLEVQYCRRLLEGC